MQTNIPGTVEYEAAQAYRAQGEVARLRAALLEIATSPHCQYSEDTNSYGIGAADGHRCAAKTAKRALGMEE